jgi:hypothetical protein
VFGERAQREGVSKALCVNKFMEQGVQLNAPTQRWKCRFTLKHLSDNAGRSVRVASDERPYKSKRPTTF